MSTIKACSMIRALLTAAGREKMKTAVISINSTGDAIADKLKENFEFDLYSKSLLADFNLKKLSKRLFKEYDALIFITSTGIAVRAIAPYLIGKDIDPAVVVIDSFGKYVISLLSGHLGGANQLTLDLAKALEAQPVVTTATDIIGIEAPDMIAKENGLIIENLKKAKDIAALLVEGKPVAFKDNKDRISMPKGYIADLQEAEGIVYVTNSINAMELDRNFKTENKENSKGIENVDLTDVSVESCPSKMLKLIRRDIILGIGCKKDYPEEEMVIAVLKELEEYNIDKRAVKLICTVELKAKEKAILYLAKQLDAELRIVSLEEIKAVQHLFKGSDFVEKSIGVRAVCEPCVHLSGGRLVSEKLNLNGMTLCIGEEY